MISGRETNNCKSSPRCCIHGNVKGLIMNVKSNLSQQVQQEGFMSQCQALCNTVLMRVISRLFFSQCSCFLWLSASCIWWRLWLDDWILAWRFDPGSGACLSRKTDLYWADSSWECRSCEIEADWLNENTYRKAAAADLTAGTLDKVSVCWHTPLFCLTLLYIWS